MSFLVGLEDVTLHIILASCTCSNSRLRETTQQKFLCAESGDYTEETIQLTQGARGPIQLGGSQSWSENSPKNLPAAVSSTQVSINLLE